MNLTRTIIGVVITMCMLPLCSLTFNYVSSIKFEYDEINDQIALCQLRENLLIAYDTHIGRNELSFRYKNKNYSLSLVNGKLILQPGTQIFLYDVDDLSFMIKNNCIYIEYEKDNKKYESVIAPEKGIYLDDFSDCDVLPSECDSAEE